jgi:two-component system cell cycle sensor histidine kinase/response regulator CckA
MPLRVNADEFFALLLVQALGGLLLVGVCALLSAHRRRTYFRDWTLAAFCAVAWQITAALPPSSGVVPALEGWLSCLFALWHAALWVLGVVRYRRALQVSPGNAPPGLRWTRADLLIPAGAALLAGPLALLVPETLRRDVLLVLVGLAYGAGGVGLVGRPAVATCLLAGVLILDALGRFFATGRTGVLAAFPGLPADSVFGILLDFVLLVLTVVATIVVLLDEGEEELRDALGRLAESEDRLRLLIEHGGVGLALLSPEGYFVHANPALTRLLGYTAEELRGRRLADLTHPEDRSSSYVVHANAARPAPAPPGAPHERDKRFLHKDGRELWVRVIRVPVYGPDGALCYHAGVLVDVTERRLAEKALHVSEQWLRLRLEQAFDGIAVWSEVGAFCDANPALCRLLGQERAALLCRTALDVAADPEAMKEHLKRVRTGGADRRELRLRGPAGKPVEVEISSTLVEVEEQRFIQGILRDVTEQRRLEEHLAHARKMEMLATLAGGIAHDFNNQLTAILGNLGLALGDLRRLLAANEAPTLETTLRDMVAEVSGAEGAAERCARMTARLLTFSRGRDGPTCAVSPGAVLAETARLLQCDFPPAIQVRVAAPADTWPVQADVGELHELLLNLAANARDAMPGGGVLTLAAANRELNPEDCAANLQARPGRFVELRVEDTGAGMTPEVRSRIFEPLFSTRGPGRGMGLAVVFGIVRGLGGWITVRSQPGAGSTFLVYLPACWEDKETRRQGDKETRSQEEESPAMVSLPALPSSVSLSPCLPVSLSADAPAASGQRCILVADDEPLVRDLARAVLERAGYRVLTAADGEEALKSYRTAAGAIDLLLLDYTMPKLTGLQVMEALRQVGAPVPVVLSSGYALDGEVQQFLVAGARAFMPKPYRPQELVQTVRRVLEQV